MKVKWLVILLAVAVGVGMYAGDVLARSQAGVTTTQLGKATFDEIDVHANAHTLPQDLWSAFVKTHGLSDVYVVDNKIAPGGDTGWHTHPGPSLILVVQGTVSNHSSDSPGCAPEVYPAGTGFVDPGGSDVHTLRNEGSDTAETIAVQLLPKDAPRKTDAAPPAGCA